jgi:hypothetical protein
VAEALITIGGVELTEAQSMALRVAITTQVERMAQENVLGDDELGKAMAQGYRDRSSEVLNLIMKSIKA